jgi:hypothetical protein
LFLVSFFFLGLQNFHPILNTGSGHNDYLWSRLIPIFWIGLGLLIWGFKSMPLTAAAGDIGKISSRVCLFFILLLTAFLRLYGASDFPAHYWEDFQLAIVDACQLTDYNRFFIYGKFQDGEPLYAYAMALLMRFFPDLDGIFVQRLVLAFFDLATLWAVYLIGKEFGKRRIGLLAASFGAISKPMLMIILSYMRYGTAQLAVALLLLFSLRLFKKPDFKHFLQWAAALAAGYYTYTAFQTFGFVMVFVVFLWVLFHEKGKPFRFWEWVLGWGCMAFLALLFLYSHRAALKEETFSRYLVYDLLGDREFIFFLALGLAWAFFQHLQGTLLEKRDKTMVYYVTALVLALILVLPAFQAGVAGYLGVPFLDETRGMSLAHSAGIFGHRVALTFLTLFYWGMDRGDINLIGDPFFGVTDLTFLFPGVILIALWPSWPKLFIFLAALTGLIPHLLADPGGNRLVGCIVPFLLVGALGFNHLLEAASFASKPALWRRLGVLAWVGLLAFGALTTFEKVHLRFNRDNYGQIYICEQIRKDSATSRVYGVYDQFGPVAIMSERSLSYKLWEDSNEIMLEPSEEKPDVVVLLQESYLPNLSLTDLPDRLKNQFPGAQWSKIRLNPTHPGDEPKDLLRMFIPKSLLSEDKSKLIYVQRIPGVRWTRRLYYSGYRMGYGIVAGEDRVADLSAPFPESYKKFDPLPSVRCIVSLDVPAGGSVRFALENDHPTDLWVDGKRVLRLRPDQKIRREAGLRLSPGRHDVQITTHHPRAFKLPEVSVLLPGAKEWKPL